jgi:hypothetical protein
LHASLNVKSEAEALLVVNWLTSLSPVSVREQ